jgi:hypothetical protein
VEDVPLPPPKLPFAACIEKDASKNATRVKNPLIFPKEKISTVNVEKSGPKKC